MRNRLHLKFGMALLGTVALAGCAQEPAPVVSGYNGASLRPMAVNKVQAGPAKLEVEPAELPAATVEAAETTVPDTIAVENIEPAAGPASAAPVTSQVQVTQQATLVPTTAQRPVATARPAPTPSKPAIKMVRHVVEPTDTVYSLASKYESSAADILKQNNMKAVSDIRVGQVLDIPAYSQPRTSFLDQMKQALAVPPQPVNVPGTAAVATQNPVQHAEVDVAAIEPAAGPAVAATTPVAETATAQGPDDIQLVTHKVERGETIYRISRSYGASVLDIMAANDFETPQDLKYGTLVKVPVQTTQVAANAAKAEPAAGPVANPAGLQAPVAAEVTTAAAEDSRTAAQETAAVSSEDSEAAEKETDAKVAAAPARKDSVAEELKAELKRGQVDPVASRAEGKVWPVKGKILRHFGQGDDGSTYTGINIAVPAGTPVLATDTGTVLYADDGLKTYGKLVLLRHKDGTVSAYAHNGHLLVRKGESVKKGQIIAVSGASGNVDVPQLHFELRQHASAVDPMRVLPKL